MRPWRCGTRTVTALLIALGVIGFTFVGCAGRRLTTPATSTTSTTKPVVAYDISRVVTIKGDVPPGSVVEVRPARIVTAGDLESSEVVELTKALITPFDCRSVVLPPYLDLPAGSQAAEVRAVLADHSGVHVVALRSPTPMPVTQPPAICEMEILISGPPGVAGTAEHIRAPDIAGVDTTGLKLAHGERDAQYMYTAALDEQTLVVVMGSAAAKHNPQQFLSDLLAKAVAAVGGR